MGETLHVLSKAAFFLITERTKQSKKDTSFHLVLFVAYVHSGHCRGMWPVATAIIQLEIKLLRRQKKEVNTADFPLALCHCSGIETQTAAGKECRLIPQSFCCQGCQVNPKDGAIDFLLLSQGLGKPRWPSNPRFTKERTIRRREAKDIPERRLNFQGLRDVCYQYLACGLHREEWNLDLSQVSGVRLRNGKSLGECTVCSTLVETLQSQWANWDDSKIALED